MKQSKLRRRRVIRFALLYFVMFVIFLALVILPAIAGSKFVGDALSGVGLLSDNMLIQPDRPNNNTSDEPTGVWASGGGKSKASSTSDSKRAMLF